MGTYKAHGKEKGPQSEAKGSAVASGTVNQNSNACAKGLKGTSKNPNKY